MEVFAVLVCCAIAAALGFFIGVIGELERIAALMIENNKRREPIKSEVQQSTVRNGTTIYALRDGTKIAFDGSNSVVTIDRGDGKGVDIYKSIVVDPLKVTKDQREVGKLRELAIDYGTIERGEP